MSSATLAVPDRWAAHLAGEIGRTPLGEPEALTDLRRAAMARFSELGFPTTRQEDWRFTNVKRIAEGTFPPVERPGSVADEVVRRWAYGAPHRLVMVDGFVDRAASELDGLPGGVFAGGLAEALEACPDAVLEHLARHARFEDHAFAALNTALFRDAAVIVVPRDVILEQPLAVVSLASTADAGRAVFPRVLVIAGEASQVTVIETHAGPDQPDLHVPVTEIVAEAGAVVDHVRLQREGAGTFHVGVQHGVQEASSTVTSHAVSVGGELARVDLVHELVGEGASAVLNGLYLVEGRQHADTHMRVEHAAAHCESHELYKGVLDGRGTAVFNGLIHVHPGAQKTNAKQSNRNLLLSREAVANSNPQLLIYADDVKCTHGSTVGQLDEDAIFYLRSRGIGEAAARSMLTYAFAAEVVAGIRIEAVRDDLSELLFGRLPQGEVVRQSV